MRRWLSSLCALLLFSVAASAQTDIYPLTSNQWVQSAVSGVLKGRIFVLQPDGTAVGVENARVVINSIDEGSFRGQTTTNAFGEFTIRGVETGVYSLTSSAENASHHQALQVIDTNVDYDGRFPRVAEISATPMPYARFRQIVRRYESEFRRRRISMRTADLEELTQHIVNDETYRVAQVDGGVDGRIYIAGGYGKRLIPAPLTNVIIVKDGVEVGRAITDSDGDFRIDDLAPGTYSLLAIGRDGIASLGFELTDAAESLSSLTTSDGKQFVTNGSSINEFRCQISPLDPDEEEVEGGPDGVPIGGGPGYAPGGGAGGVSGVGDLAGLAGLGAALAAASSGGGGSSTIGTPPIATPSEPETEPEVEPFLSTSP